MVETDEITKILFGRMPRELANPTRFVVNSTAEMEKYIKYNNGTKNLYTSIYPSNRLIDKIFFDFDYGPTVLQDTKRVYRKILDKGFDAIPLTSGIKPGSIIPRYHLYMITHPKIYGPQSKLFLTKATKYIIKETFGSFKQEPFTFPNGKEKQIFRTEDRIIAPDPACCGDIRRIARLPSSLRPPDNLSYCTYLPQYDFLDMEEEDIIQHARNTHSYKYEINFKDAPYLTDFEYDFESEPKWKPLQGKVKHRYNSVENGDITTSNPSLFLKFLLRPCLYKHITSIHPSQPVRASVAVDLILYGYGDEAILKIFSVLGWEDFEEGKCLEQIRSCHYENHYSCTKLKSYGIPQECCIG